MGARGPKPRPPKLARLAGERKDRINAAAPELPSGIPEPPAELSPAAAVEWSRLAEELAPLGVLTRADRGILELLAESWARYRAAQAKLRTTPSVTRTGAGGFRLSPYMQIAQAEADRIARLSAEIGGTPSGRGRLKVGGKADDPTAEIRAFLAATRAG